MTPQDQAPFTIYIQTISRAIAKLQVNRNAMYQKLTHQNISMKFDEKMLSLKTQLADLSPVESINLCISL